MYARQTRHLVKQNFVAVIGVVVFVIQGDHAFISIKDVPFGQVNRSVYSLLNDLRSQ